MTGPPAFRGRHSGPGKFPYSRKSDPVGWRVQDAARVRVLRVANLKAACDPSLPPTVRHWHCRNPGPSQQFGTGHLRFVNGSTSRLRSNVRLGGDRLCCRRGSGGRSEYRMVRCGPCDDIADFSARGGRVREFRRRMNRDLPRPYGGFLPVAIFPSLASMQVLAFRPNRNPLSRRRTPGLARPTLLSNAQPTGGGHRAQA